ncbi:MAG: CoA-binding protein [Bacteroidota bacterium]
MGSKTTLVLGASSKPHRYSNMAVRSLLAHGEIVLAVGARPGQVESVNILVGKPVFKDVDTITLYLSPENQQPLYSYVLSLQPRRVIFNPGTENREFELILQKNGIETIIACTLVMLSTHQYR